MAGARVRKNIGRLRLGDAKKLGIAAMQNSSLQAMPNPRNSLDRADKPTIQPFPHPGILSHQLVG
jgi:hypothetical protein